MSFVISLISATLWLIVGYFVLFSTSKTDSVGIRLFGVILSIWIFVIAAAIVIAAGYFTVAGLCHIGDMMRSMHSARPS